MNPDDLRTTVHVLRDNAYSIRVTRNALIHETPALPASVTHNMAASAQLLDDAARDLLNAYGEDLPDGVL